MIPASDKDTQGPHNFRKNLVKIKKNYTDGGFSSDEEAKSEKLEPWDDAPQYINQMKPRQPPNDREPGKVEEKEEVKVAGVVIKDQPITGGLGINLGQIFQEMIDLARNLAQKF